MPERSSIPIPDEAVIALAKANKVISDSRWAGEDDWDIDDYGNRVVVREGLTEQERAHWIEVYREDLEAAAPKLYAHWAEQLVERIRTEGFVSSLLYGRVLEARVDAVAETIYEMSRRGGDPWSKLPDDSWSSWEPNRNQFRRIARNTLGLDEGEETPQ